MKRVLLLILLSVVCCSLRAQTNLTLVTPPGMEEPYEVDAGTTITLRASGNPPTRFFSYAAEPDLNDQYVIDTRWTQYTNFKDNGNGTYDFTLPINNTIYLWTGSRMDFTGMWGYSNVIKISLASGVKITATDGLLCPGTDTETLLVTGTYASYAWYFNDEIIPGATASTYNATTPGRYKVQVPLSGKNVFSNTLHVKTAFITMAGGVSGTALTLKAAAGATSYQWLSGTSATALSPIGAATTNTYVATLNANKIYYAIRAVVAGCIVQSEARAASTAIFAKPVVTVVAPTNAFGKTCEGTQVTLSVPEQYSTYLWYKDNALHAEGMSSLALFDGTGNYKVDVTVAEWPEITIASDAKKVTYFKLAEPVVTGANYSAYCPGQSVTLTLVDEGYTYNWYKHSTYNYTEADEISVPDGEYTFTVSGTEYVTIVGNYLGCVVSKMIPIQSFASGSITPELSDYSPYLCPGKAVVATVTEGEAANYASFQWYELSGNSYVAIGGATAASYTISEAGTYRVHGVPQGCNGIEVISEPITLLDNTTRPFTIESDQADICIGGQVTLSVSSEWTSIQWLEKKIVMGATQGYDETYVPISGAGSGNTLTVSKFNGYVVKARHVECATGVKVTSSVFTLKPRVNPTITVDPAKEAWMWRKAPYDSIADYVYCDAAPTKLTLPNIYTSYKWYAMTYHGDDNFELGTAVENATGNTLSLRADGAIWYTAEVVQNGCKGLSDPVLIDTYVHSTPAVASRNNAELCNPGDSTMLNNAFVSENWVKFEWLKDGIIVPDSDNDTLYAKAPGGYILVAYPKECPDIGYSSGVPVPVKFMEKAMIYEDDTVVWATPFMGFYNYQWYANDKALTPEEIPAILHKRAMKSGEYTVTVTNPVGCGRTSDPYMWIITANEEHPDNEFVIYPNPTPGGFVISGLDARTVQSVTIYTAQGLPIYTQAARGLQPFNLSAQAPGVYIVEAVLLDGTIKKAKVIRS